MAEILPFRGLRYNLDEVRLDDVVAPPYDVISPAQAETLRTRSPCNVVRLILPQDGPDGDCYARAGDTLTEWRHREILTEERVSAIYVCRRTFEVEGRTLRRTGFFTAVKLEAFGEKHVFPHESTLSAHKEDRLRLLKATRTNLSPIFSIFPDSDRRSLSLLEEMMRSEPAVTLTDPPRREGEVGSCELWVVSDTEVIKRLTDLLEPARLFIADGHHRYETALNYRDSLGDGRPASTDYVMMFCVPMDQPGLVTLPTHRMVSPTALSDWSGFMEALKEDFDLTEVSADDGFPKLPETDAGFGTFVLYAGARGTWVVSLKPERTPANIDPEKSEVWSRLDVSVLQRRIFEPVLGLGLDQLIDTSKVAYSHDLAEAVEGVDAGRFAFAFLLRPTPVTSVASVAEYLEKLPPKSTYFYPKVLTGLVFRALS